MPELFQIEVTGDLANLDTFIAKVARIDEVTGQMFEEAVATQDDTLIEALSADVPEASYTFDNPPEWTSDKQRQAYWASDGFGQGIPTQRTGAMPNGWQSETFIDQSGWMYQVRNITPNSVFVYGFGAVDADFAQTYQQGFHATTGHPLASPMIVSAFEAIILDFNTRVVDYFGDDSFTARTP